MTNSEGTFLLDGSRESRRAYRRGVRRLILDLKLRYMVTLAFNGPTYLNSAREAVRSLHARLDHFLIGRQWATRPSQRTLFVCFIEHSLSNFHCHLAVRFRCGSRPADIDLENAIQRIWHDLVPSGSAQLDHFDSREALSVYITKELFHNRHFEHFIVSTEFEPERRALHAKSFKAGFVERVSAGCYGWHATLEAPMSSTKSVGVGVLGSLKSALAVSLFGSRHRPKFEMFAVPERRPGRIVCHVLLDVAPEATFDWIEEGFREAWNELAPGGSVRVEPLFIQDCPEGLAMHLLKRADFANAVHETVS